jgi:eukaryotic-like serine/threonine-protein kinase
VDWLYREARILAALDHPNLVRIYDVEQVDRINFLVLERVDGCDLHELVRRCGPLSAIRVAHYGRQAALALQHLWNHGVVHRNISPDHLILDWSGTIKLVGLSDAFTNNPEFQIPFYHERSGEVVVMPDFTAPEQALDCFSVDCRADVYALGATLYFCLTGRVPFPEGTIAQKLMGHQARWPTPVHDLRSDVPEALIGVIHRMMEKDPAQRYQTPSKVAEALKPWTATPIPPPTREENACCGIMILEHADIVHDRDRRSPSRRGDLRSAPGHGQETVPQRRSKATLRRSGAKPCSRPWNALLAEDIMRMGHSWLLTDSENKR